MVVEGVLHILRSCCRVPPAHQSEPLAELARFRRIMMAFFGAFGFQAVAGAGLMALDGVVEDQLGVDSSSPLHQLPLFFMAANFVGGVLVFRCVRGPPAALPRFGDTQPACPSM